jgi:hypothetical protein
MAYPSAADAAYLIRLAAWGYSPSEVEKVVIGDGERADTVEEVGSPIANRDE